jgi:aspartyl-tRNA(Asn)/glutamyl-tRNA(Gln) amidotransferase subunit B
MRSSAEAVAYARALHSLVRWIGICDGNMQEGSFRCDANVSVRRVGDPKLGTRCEIKNVNSFRFLEKAIEYEVRRQIEVIEDGGKIVQETRLYDADRDETRSMRSKEDAQDYRYFPDPDLLPLAIGAEWIARVRSELPPLPSALRTRYLSQHSLSAYDAALLTESRDKAAYFDEVVAASGVPAKLASNWITGELSALLNERGVDFDAPPVGAGDFAVLLARVHDGTISAKSAKDVLQAMAAGEGGADAIIEKRGLKQISDSGAVEAAVDQVMAANPRLVDDFRSGKEKAFNALVGQVMKATQGKANPAQVNAILRAKLG